MEKPLDRSVMLQSRDALSTEIANKLCLWIRKEQKIPGTVLGTEVMLAQKFGVSRTVIREAIGQLRGLGLVTSRQGLGLCVANSDTMETIAKVLVPMVADKVSWTKLCHMRFVLEVGSIPLAVERITTEQMERMQQLASEMKSLLHGKRSIPKKVEERIAQFEIDFHQIIFDAAGCEFTEQFHSILVEYFNESSVDGRYRVVPTMKDMNDHVKLAKAISQRNVGQAVAIMVDHIRHTLRDE